jgi:hypothetical protein
MEELYPRIERTDTPVVYLRALGAGRVVYFPGDLDRTFWELLIPDHARLLANAIAWALAEPAAVRVTGPGFVDVTHWRQERSITVHLVNLTNPMTMRGFYREFLPLPPQQVSIALPPGARAVRARLLVAGRDVPIGEPAGPIQLEVANIAAHEVIAIDLA